MDANGNARSTLFFERARGLDDFTDQDQKKLEKRYTRKYSENETEDEHKERLKRKASSMTMFLNETEKKRNIEENFLTLFKIGDDEEEEEHFDDRFWKGNRVWNASKNYYKNGSSGENLFNVPPHIIDDVIAKGTDIVIHYSLKRTKDTSADALKAEAAGQGTSYVYTIHTLLTCTNLTTKKTKSISLNYGGLSFRRIPDNKTAKNRNNKDAHTLLHVKRNIVYSMLSALMECVPDLFFIDEFAGGSTDPNDIVPWTSSGHYSFLNGLSPLPSLRSRIHALVGNMGYTFSTLNIRTNED